MSDFAEIKTKLDNGFNREKSRGIDIDINVNVINETNGKFSVSVFDEKCFVKHFADVQCQTRTQHSPISDSGCQFKRIV